MGTLAQLFETGEQTSQKGHFRNLILIARFDGKVMDSEKKLLQTIANRLSLTEEQVSEIIDHPEQYPVIPPYSREERYERFIQLTEMALIDGVMTAEEEKLIKQLGVSLGFSQDTISEKFKVIVEKVKSGVKRDQILSGLL
ncbi:MAG: hypothetical protein K0R65_1666 [Crocinitomicaceae bacterium]|jgi:uncharacterized tellurite resistance protein B-like protein|nr:hypothetical protein [Crocinitomicaceae bacterium]